MMKPSYFVYDDRIISVGLFTENEEADEKDILTLGMRWLPPEPCKESDGRWTEVTNLMGGETDWFLLPHTFGVAVGRTLIEQKVADCGLTPYFDESGFKRMVRWLVEMEELTDSMCY
jgi:hypothetical protein